MKKLLFTVALAAIAATVVCSFVIARLRSENQRLERNQSALMKDVEYYVTKSGESAASVEVLQLEVDELKRYRKEATEHIRQLGIKLRYAESYARSGVRSNYTEHLVLRDTVILRDTIRDTVRIFEGGDAWSTMRGEVRGDSLAYNFESVDTLYQVVERVPRKFLFIRYGTKAIRQHIVSSNPHTKLVYSEYIELPRRRRK
ncbi:MAG: hypothetical protein II288_05185 [Alistipes sp.]|jgi:hypothetical protein|nr:hypothetical protein [Alistipes sp.]